MRSLIVFVLLLSVLTLTNCSRTTDGPVSPIDTKSALSLDVNASQIYYLNLAQDSTVFVTDSLMDSSWDITIRNLTSIYLNGGSTAPGKVFAVKVENTNYDDLSTAPDVEYKTDTQDSLLIGDSWYSYNMQNHTVNPLDHFYVIKANDDLYYKFQIIESTFASRTDGTLKIKMDKINSPSNPDFQPANGRVQYFKLPMSNSGVNYFNFNNSDLVNIADSSTSLDWDISTSYVNVSLNGNINGPGQAACIVLENAQFDSINIAPSSGYQADSTSGYVIGTSWYNYDQNTHIISPKPNVYILKTAQGNYAKLEFTATVFENANNGFALMRYEYIEGTMNF